VIEDTQLHTANTYKTTHGFSIDKE